MNTLHTGSCGLEYRLVQVPDVLRRPESHTLPSRFSRWTQSMHSQLPFNPSLPAYAYTLTGAMDDPLGTIFMIIWVSFLIFLLYAFLKSCFSSRPSSTPRPRPRGGPSNSGWSNWFNNSGSGSGGGGRPYHPNDPPPPYSGPKPSNSTQNASEGWRPGFWTGAALGGLGTYLFNNNNNNNRQQDPQARRAPMYDWEYERFGGPTTMNTGMGSGSGGLFGGGGARRSAWGSGSGSGSGSRGNEDRGEGSSSGLGSMRRSTGFGGSSVR